MANKDQYSDEGNSPNDHQQHLLMQYMLLTVVMSFTNQLEMIMVFSPCLVLA